MASAVAPGGRRGFGIATGSFVAERDDWPTAVGRARREGWSLLELTAIEERRLDALVRFLADDPQALDGFERISVHAPVRFHEQPTDVRETLSSLPYLEAELDEGARWAI